jgi:hypothetical protein
MIGAVSASEPAKADLGSFLARAGRIGAEMERQQHEQARRQLELERMRLCNEIIRLGGQCGAPQNIAPADDYSYERATLIGQVRTGDISINTCNYRTVRGYFFHVNYRGICPYGVRVNPETNWVLFN